VDRLFDWLASPAGIEATHAVVLLITASAGILAARARAVGKQNQRMLNAHMDAHVQQALDAAGRSESEQ
jgi:hypothetical protein